MSYDYSITGAELINVRERFKPAGIVVPKVDELVSKIVGKKVFKSDPRLIRLIVSWKKNKPADSKEPDNFLNDPKHIEELKKVFS